MERPHCKEFMKMSLCLTFEIVPPTVDQASLVHFVAQADLKHTTLLLLHTPGMCGLLGLQYRP